MLFNADGTVKGFYLTWEDNAFSIKFQVNLPGKKLEDFRFRRSSLTQHTTRAFLQQTRMTECEWIGQTGSICRPSRHPAE